MNWNKEQYEIFINDLRKKQDLKYKEFNERIIFTNYEIIGIRAPQLRTIAKDISKTEYNSFLKEIKSNTYEEVLIEGLVISHIKDLEEAISYFDKFISKIDNWGICDMVVSSMKIVKKNKEYFLEKIRNYLKDSHEYIVRVGVILLLDFYLEEEYLDEVFNLIDNINREEYYINMAIAWLISIALVKYKDKTLEYLKRCKLNDFTYNKALQKARESTRVSIEDKEYFQNLKRK